MVYKDLLTLSFQSILNSGIHFISIHVLLPKEISYLWRQYTKPSRDIKCACQSNSMNMSCKELSILPGQLCRFFS